MAMARNLSPNKIKRSRSIKNYRLKQILKFSHGQTDLFNNYSHCAFGHVLVIRDNYSAKRFFQLPQYHMASALSVKFITDLAQSLNYFSPGQLRKIAHAATSTISSVIGGGTGSLCASRLSR